MRTSEIARRTAETDIVLEVNLDGTGKSRVQTGQGRNIHRLRLSRPYADPVFGPRPL